ncbi:MAG: nucleotidyltransferase family protein [Gemmatimonadaceae bacterium]
MRSADPAGLGGAPAHYPRRAGATPGPTGRAPSAAAAELAAAGPDWADVRALARRERVTAALWPRLRRALELAPGAVVLPGEVEEAFRREAMVAEFDARRMEALLHEVLATLAARGIEPLLLKGAGLAYTVFGGMARRPMRDLDLLVPREALAPAVAALRAAGWEEANSDRPAGRYAAHQHAPPLVAPGGVGEVELHDALFPPGHPFLMDGGAVLARARWVPSPVGAVLVPAPADQLIHACLHFAWSHELRWGAWRAMADVAALVGAAAAEDAAPADVAGGSLGGADAVVGARALDELADEGRAAGGGSAVYWTLRLSALLAGVPVPEPWLAALAPGGWGEWALLERHLAHQLLPGPGNAPSVALARLGWAAALRPGRSGHGRSRPWLVGAALAEAERSGAGLRGSSRLRAIGRQVMSAGRWRRYAGALLG